MGLGDYFRRKESPHEAAGRVYNTWNFSSSSGGRGRGGGISFDQGTLDSPVSGLVLLLLVPKGLLCYQKVVDLLSCIDYEARGDEV
ncbi:hypothetical protein KY289_017041 [Solanum tuberosum]|nr:hypothetical protein KY284_016840 [Solanum tuberosum]KAH0689683.1 hypothetical protein KY289_017041 [Solanum tuberosum]